VQKSGTTALASGNDLKLFSNLHNVLLKMGQDDDPYLQELLRCTRLGCSSLQEWCRKRIRAMMESIMEQIQSRTKAAAGMTKALYDQLGSLPSCEDESVYRDALARLMKKMSSDAVRAKRSVDDLQTLLRCLLDYAPAGGSGFPAIPRDLVAASRDTTSLLKDVGLVTASHVTFFACLTLLRSPTLGGKSDAGKKAANDLFALLVTLLNDLKITSRSSALPHEALDSFIPEMITAVP
jgi:hypothetical protein